MKADQICYSVLCVFSYVAAGQDQKKNPVVITPQIQDIHAQQKQQHAQQHTPGVSSSAGGGSTSPRLGPQPLSPKPPTSPAPLPQQPSSKLQTVTIRHTMPMQKPTITTTTVQPQAKVPGAIIGTHSSGQQQQRSPTQHLASRQTASITTTTTTTQIDHSASTSTSSTTTTTTALPQLPPRVPSQSSTESISPTPSTGAVSKLRGPPPGPPPAIPPRTGAIGRSGSVQVGPSLGAARSFVRQISATSTPPQYTPQPPPPFVIPTRRTSLTRQSSAAPTVGASSNLTTNSRTNTSSSSISSQGSGGGSPQSARRH